MQLQFKYHSDVIDRKKALGQSFHIRLVLDTDDADQWSRVIDAIKRALAEPIEIEEKKPALGFHKDEEEDEYLEEE